MVPKKTKFDSIKTGKLAKGCKQCVKGEKSVLFITGLCPRRCSYCPISDYKKNKDVTFINEWETRDEDELITEIKLCKSKGVGITGGDPFVTIERTEKYIRLLKAVFGKKFHIHIYTSLDLITYDNLKKLYDAGLDEIRVHPDFNKENQWDKMKQLKRFDWKIVMEIPAIPNELEQTKKLLEKTHIYIDYLNLNELEAADNEFSTIGKEYKTKDELSYAIDKSEKVALEIMAYANELGINNVHFCTAKLKDAHQLAKRIHRRAKSVKLKTDKKTKEGMLIRGAIYFKKFEGNKKVVASDVEKIEEAKERLIEKGVKKLTVDIHFARLLTSPRNIKKHAETIKKLKLFPYIMEEYPTKDAFPIEIEEL